MSNDRLHAVEGSTVRLYFRSYVSNILTDVDPVTCQIQARTSTIVLANLPVTKESTGIYYVDWAIPSSVVGSLKYSASFPGAGDYNDIWTYTGGSLTQDFYVFPENWPNDLAKITEPIKLNHILETPRMESGAKDFITWRIQEQNGKLVNGESLFPEGEIELWYGSNVIQNYKPFIHKEDSDQYKFYIDTTALRNGVYKARSRFIVPQTTVNTQAIVTGQRSLQNGFSSASNNILNLTIDSINRLIDFPSTSTRAYIESTVNSLDFSKTNNDLFIINIAGTEKQIRLVNTVAVKPLVTLVAELNGTMPTEYPGLVFPLVTSSKVLLSVPTGLANTTLIFKVDGIRYTTQFSNSVATINDIVLALNTTYTGIAGNNSGIIYLGGLAGLEEIEIVGGTSLSLLGFVEGQYDDNVHSVTPAVASIDVSSVKIEYTVPNTTIKISSADEGSVANNYMGFSSAGESDTATEAIAAYYEGNNATYPILVTEPSYAVVLGTTAISDFTPSTSFPYATTLDGKTLKVSINGSPLTTVTFTDSKNPAAITSTLSSGSFSVHGLTLSINNGVTTSVTTFTSTPANTDMSLVTIINQINAQLATDLVTNVIADMYQGRLRIRATTNTVTLTMLSTATGFNLLGFNGIPTNPEKYYQNSQVYASGLNIIAAPYVNTYTRAEIVSDLNAGLGGAYSSLSSNRVKLQSLTTGSSQSITVDGTGTANSLLYLSGTGTGSDGGNDYLDIDAGAGPVTVSFTAGSKSLNDIVNAINSQAIGFYATRAGTNTNQLKILSTTSGITSTISITSPYLNIFFGSSPIIVTPGIDGDNATLIGTVYTPTRFKSGGNADFYISIDGNPLSYIDLNTATSITDIVTLINAVISGLASNPSGNILRLENVNAGSVYSITVGGINDGSNANTVLGLARNGLNITGTDGIPYTLTEIINRVNAAFGGNVVATNSSNYLRINSISEGATALITIEDSTSPDILTNWGIARGTFIGTSTTQVSQTIVSPKLTLIIGD